MKENKSIANEAAREAVLLEMQSRAHRHWWVGTITVASAAFVLVMTCLLAFIWVLVPLWNVAPNIEAPAASVVAGVRVFALAILGYLIGVLVSMYRYNIQLWGHYTTRAWALRLASDELTLEKLARVLSTSPITFPPSPTEKSVELLEGVTKGGGSKE